MSPPEAMTLSVWVSTDATPLIRRMRIGVTLPARVGGEGTTPTTYSLTWTWSRFNEDFGEVVPPATETVK
jgi:hypothetical protein